VSSPRTRKGTLLPSPSSSAPAIPSGLTVEQKRDEFSVNSVYESLESSVPPGFVSPDPCPLISLGPLGSDEEEFSSKFQLGISDHSPDQNVRAIEPPVSRHQAFEIRFVALRAFRHRACRTLGYWAPVCRASKLCVTGLPVTGLPGFIGSVYQALVCRAPGFLAPVCRAPGFRTPVFRAPGFRSPVIRLSEFCHKLLVQCNGIQ